MTVGPLVAAAGCVLLARIEPSSEYLTSVLPGVLIFGLGLTIFVAPLTTAVPAAVPDQQAGLASAISNAFAPLAQLAATAVVPGAARLGAGTALGAAEFSSGFGRAMLIVAAVLVAGAAVSWATSRRAAGAARRPDPQLPADDAAGTGPGAGLAGGGAPSTLCGRRRARRSAAGGLPTPDAPTDTP